MFQFVSNSLGARLTLYYDQRSRGIIHDQGVMIAQVVSKSDGSEARGRFKITSAIAELCGIRFLSGVKSIFQKFYKQQKNKEAITAQIISVVQ